MSAKADAIRHAKNTQQSGSAIRAEFPLLVGFGTVAIFLAVGSDLNELTTRVLPLLGVFVWLFAVILWSATCVVRHADCLAIKLGEPYGTLILTLSAVSIEVVMISTAMLHGANNPTLGRDAIFAVIMIALNGLVGLSLMLGGLRYREQHYNIQGVNAYLNVIMALAVLGLVLPNFTTSTGGPTFSTEQGIFFAAVSLLLYAVFLLIQTLRHRGYFMDVIRNREQAFAASFGSRAVDGFSCADAAFVPGYRYFSCGEIRRSLGQQHRAISHATGIWRRDHRCAGALSGRTGRDQRQSAKPTAAFDKHALRVGARHDRADDSGSADDRIADETVGSPWSTGWRPTSAALNPGCQRSYVHEPENQRFAGVCSFAALRRFRASAFCALTNEPLAAAHARRSLCRSVHHDSLRPLFNDLESKSLVETQHRFASHEADRDRRVIGICADQLRQQSRADAMPAVLRFHC